MSERSRRTQSWLGQVQDPPSSRGVKIRSHGYAPIAQSAQSAKAAKVVGRKVLLEWSTSSRCSLPMPPKKPKAARQSPLGFQQFTLIKKPLDVIGKQVNVLGAFWSGHKEAIVEQNGGSVMP